MDAAGDGLSYQWRVSTNNGVNFANVKNEDGATSETLNLTAYGYRNGYQYKCVVKDRYGNKVETETVTLRIDNALRLNKQPESYVGPRGSTAAFSVEATGDDLCYQWWVSTDNGGYFAKVKNEDGATESTLRLTAYGYRDGYQYKCVIQDRYGNKMETETVTLQIGYDIIASVSGCGSVKIFQNGNAVNRAKPGEIITVVVSANDGYAIRSVTLNGKVLIAVKDSTYTFNMLSATANIVVDIVDEENAPRPLLTIIDDDGTNAFYEKWLPIIREKGVSVSTAIVSDFVGTKNYMSWDTIEKCANAGAEILCHTKDHASTEIVATRTVDEITETYLIAQSVLRSHGYDGNILVYSGASGDLSTAREAAAEVFDAAFISAGNHAITAPIEQYRIWRYVIGSSNGDAPTLDDLKEIIDMAVETNSWIVWMTHAQYKVMTQEYMAVLAEAIDYCKEVGVDIVSASEGLQIFGN